jgi:hypothetical protein
MWKTVQLVEPIRLVEQNCSSAKNCRGDAMKRQLHTLLLAAATCVLLAGSLPADGQSQRYIVILKARTGAVPDISALGGTIESRQEEQLVVTLPPASIAALRADAKVRYVERVGGTPSEGEDSLIGVPPDPTPGPASNGRLTPHALGSTSWNPGDYAYDGAGNIVSIGTDTYAYDGVQRLRQSLTRGTPEAYTYGRQAHKPDRIGGLPPTLARCRCETRKHACDDRNIARRLATN